MQFRLDRFFLDEKDLFVWTFGAVIIASYFFNFPLYPFRQESLLVVLLFLLLTRSLVDSQRFFSYLMIALFGLIFSTFLSPYGLLIYFAISLILYRKANLM